MTLLLLLTSSGTDVAVASTPASATAATSAPVLIARAVGTSAPALAGAQSHPVTVMVPAFSAASSAGTTLPNAAAVIAGASAASLASAASPVPALYVVAVADSVAGATPADVSIAAGVIAAAALAGVGQVAAVASVDPSSAAAFAVMPGASGLVSLGDYLRAALHSLEGEQVVIQAELVASVAANDEDAINANQNRASVCSIAIAEVKRAIEFDDIRGPYVTAAEASSTASAAAPVVGVS